MRRLTTTFTIIATINAGNNSYIAKTPPNPDITYFQRNIIIPPEIIPDIAPYLLALLQNNERRTTGPNVAPKPAHANDTISNTELSGLPAINTATIEMITTVILATIKAAFSESLTPIHSLTRFCDIPEAAARSCESDVDIVAARIPARITPAAMAAITP